MTSQKIEFKLLLLLVISMTPFANARENFVQKEGTYKQIVERVSKREERSGAIVAVRATGQSGPDNYDFRIIPVDESRVKVQLYWHMMTGDTGEEFILKIDDDIKNEMARQKTLEKFLAEDEKKRQEANAKKITALTNGELAFGMSRAEIEKKRGKHYRFDTWQQAGSGEMIYSDLRLIVRLGHLDDVKPAGELNEDEKKIPFEDEVKK